MLHFYSTAGMASLRRLHGHACMMASARARGGVRARAALRLFTPSLLMSRPATIKLLQYNVLYTKDTQPTPWLQRAAALRAWIAELRPDVVTLQEITLGTREDDGTQVDMLADILRGSPLVHSVFGPAEVNFPGMPGVVLGNAIASCWPIPEHEVRSLPHFEEEGVSKASSSRRSAVWARIESPSGPLSVTCTHLNGEYGGLSAVNDLTERLIL
jgi:endonuclease/exonuclease/phosphatase family metal-dependent hydrolase